MKSTTIFGSAIVVIAILAPAVYSLKCYGPGPDKFKPGCWAKASNYDTSTCVEKTCPDNPRQPQVCVKAFGYVKGNPVSIGAGCRTWTAAIGCQQGPITIPDGTAPGTICFCNDKDFCNDAAGFAPKMFLSVLSGVAAVVIHRIWRSEDKSLQFTMCLNVVFLVSIQWCRSWGVWRVYRF